jgi:hypothetical protein
MSAFSDAGYTGCQDHRWSQEVLLRISVPDSSLGVQNMPQCHGPVQKLNKLLASAPLITALLNPYGFVYTNPI